MSIQDITDGLSKINIENNSNRSIYRGPGYNNVVTNYDLNDNNMKQIFQTCSTGNEKTIPKNQVAYVIFSHGHWDRNTNPNQIVAPVDNWSNLRFGTLVKNAGAILLGQKGTNHQQSVNRFIIGIMRGNLKIYQKFPWKQTNKKNETYGYFPNIIYSEGGHQFRATIGKFYNGRVEFYKLTDSANTANTNNPRLIPFMPSKQYEPIQTIQHVSNSNCTLKNIMEVIHHDYHQNKTKHKINKINIIMATCLFNLPQNIQNIWTGNNPRYPVITGELSRKTFAESKQKSLQSRSRKTRKSRKSRKSGTTFKIGIRKTYGTIQRGRIRRRKNKEKRKLKKIQEKNKQKTIKSKSKSSSNSLKRKKTMRASKKNNKKRRLSY